MKDKHFTSRMLACAGALMSISGILIAICVKISYSGILFAAAACMFFAARNFRIAEDKKEDENQETKAEHEKESAISAGKKKKEKQSEIMAQKACVLECVLAQPSAPPLGTISASASPWVCCSVLLLEQVSKKRDEHEYCHTWKV